MSQSGRPSQGNDRSQQPTNHYFKPGTVRSIKLINFMCHDSFELEFGPRVNFVIGPNGSGKSALLTALVIVLGGRATTTSRAKKANEFVMYGKKFARITCVIHNYTKIMEKDHAFKPDDYGKRIVIEKTLYTDTTSKLVLKNEKDKKVSERKQELDEMLEHFGILINNPICILNQEVSKNFLHSKKPEDKFDLFMKATNLEQIQNDYLEAKHDHSSWGDCNNRKSVGFRVLDSEYLSCREKISFLINRAKLQDTHKELNRELVWAMIRDLEKKAEDTQQKLTKCIKNVEELESKIETSQNSIEKSKLRVEQHKEKLTTCEQECDISRKKLDEIKRKETSNRIIRIDMQNKIEMQERQLRRYKDAKKSLEKSIADLKDKINKDSGGAAEHERRKLEIEQLEREIPSEKAREKAIRQHTDQLQKSINETRAELHKSNIRLNSIASEMSGKEASLKRLKAGEQNSIRKYGDQIVKLREEIDQAHKNGHFRNKPLGPLGYYIKLKSPDVAPVMELHLGRNAHAFTCDNIQDAQTLQTLIRRVQRVSPFRAPLVLIRRFCQRHDTSKYRAHHEKYKTLLDYISIKDDGVFNALVDKTALETVLFIPEYKESENLMITPPLIPKYTRCAYTKDCHVMYPRTQHSGYRCIANDMSRMLGLFKDGNEEQILEIEHQSTILQAEKRDVEASRIRLDENYKVQQAELKSNQGEIQKILAGCRELEVRLLNLKTTLTAAQPEELLAFEAELETTLSKIAEIMMELERQRAQLTTIDDERKDLERERDSVMSISRKRDEERRKITDLIKIERETIQAHKDSIKDNEMNITINKKRQDEDKKLLEKHLEEIVTAKRNLTASDKPRQIRETSVVQSELKKVEHQLKTEIEENADPDELLASLKKRMSEIESLVELKDQNNENFQLSSKVLKDRDEGFKSLRSFTCASVSTTFSSVMRAMNMNGLLKIHLDDQIVDGQVISKAKTLEISVDTAPSSQRPGGLTQNGANTNGGFKRLADDLDSQDQNRRSTRSTRSQPADNSGPRTKRQRLNVSPSDKENKLRMADTRSLSGGERSFSTVAFVLALWHHCTSPFKLMDEIDVFMDMVTRRMSYNALIQYAQVTQDPGQFIFFSPLELPRIADYAEDMVRVFEMPKIVRKGTQQADYPTAGPSFAGTAGGDE